MAPTAAGAGVVDTCADATYDHRVDDPGNYNWCVVPGTGPDALLFAFLAIAIFCCVQGKLSAVWVMLIGGALEVWSFYYNTGRLSNAMAYWIGISPPDLFMYGFLPPLLLNSSLRIDFFLFKKVLLSAVSLAFLVVLASLALCTLPLVYMLPHWSWPHAALFTAILAPTDAVAVAAILRTAGAPELLCVLLEGESLFNDASAVVLFELFHELAEEVNQGHTVNFTLNTASTIAVKICVMGGGGAVVGLIGGFLVHMVFTILRKTNRMDDFHCVELALLLASSNLVFYIANAVLKFSGPVAVAIMGLYGAAYSRFEVNPRLVTSGVYDMFWESACFCLNGVIFFYSGVSAVNFFIRTRGEVALLAGQTYGYLPLIYILNFAARGVCVVFFSNLLRLQKAGLDARGQAFTTFTGLRGVISLVLLQMVVTGAANGGQNERLIVAQMVVWGAGFVSLTLLLNAPFIGAVLSATGLNKVSPTKLAIRSKAWRALQRFSGSAVKDLQEDGDEVMRGVDWGLVKQYIDLEADAGSLCGDTRPAPGDTRSYLQASLRANRPQDAGVEAAEGLQEGLLRGETLTAEAAGDEQPTRLTRQASGLTESRETLKSLFVRRCDEEADPMEADGVYGMIRDDSLVQSGSDLDADPGSVDEQPRPPASSLRGFRQTSQISEAQGSDSLSSLGDRSNRHTHLHLQAMLSVDTTGPSTNEVLSAMEAAVKEVSRERGSLQTVSELADPMVPELDDEALEEARVRLLSGMKRYFHSKRAEGLLSYQGLRILDHAADTCIEDKHKPLRIFQLVRREMLITRSPIPLAISSLACFASRVSDAAKRQPYLVRKADHIFLRPLRALLLKWLSFHQLLAIETCIECLLALRVGPQSGWLHAMKHAGEIEAEVAREVAHAERFLSHREMESPLRFRAIQTFRASVSILTRMEHFVHEMESTGMVDEVDAGILMAPISMRQRLLQNRGPNWKAPSVVTTLQELPCFSNLPREVFLAVWRAGELLTFEPGQVVYETARSERSGLYFVVYGLVAGHHCGDPATQRSSLVDNRAAMYYGYGAVFGLYSALLNARLGDYVGHDLELMAYGQSVGKGPTVFHIPPDAMDSFRLQARRGDVGMQLLEINLFRLLSGVSISFLEGHLLAQLQQDHVLLKQYFAAQVSKAAGEQSDHAGSDLLHFWITDDTGDQAAAQPMDLAARYLEEISHDVQAASLLELSPGQGLHQRSTLFLLHGSVSLHTFCHEDSGAHAQHGASHSGEWCTMEEEFRAPYFLFGYRGLALKAGKRLVVAGAQGALLMECEPKLGGLPAEEANLMTAEDMMPEADEAFMAGGSGASPPTPIPLAHSPETGKQPSRLISRKLSMSHAEFVRDSVELQSALLQAGAPRRVVADSSERLSAAVNSCIGQDRVTKQ